MLRVAMFGRERLVSPLVAQLLGPEAHRSVEAASDADLVVTDIRRDEAARFRRDGWIVVPDAVRWTAGAPGDGLASDLAMLDRQGFRMEPSTSDEDWGRFAAGTLAPEGRARFGAPAWRPSARMLREIQRAGALHLIRLDGQVVAGACIVAAGGAIWLPLLGVLDGEPCPLRRGAGVAAMALPLAWAWSRGCRRVDAARTGPFLGDGVLAMKRRWNLRPVSDPLSHLAAFRLARPEVHATLASWPSLVEGESGIEASGAPARGGWRARPVAHRIFAGAARRWSDIRRPSPHGFRKDS